MFNTTQPIALRPSPWHGLLKQGGALWQRLQEMRQPMPAHPQRQLQRALRRAYQRFAVEQPRWANSLFDHHFLLHDAAPIFNSIYRQARWPTAYELALAWFAQLHPQDGVYAPAKINAALSPATAFLRLLREEWSA